MKKQNNKPIIETLINTSAIVLFTVGTQMLSSKDVFGFGLVLLGAGLEFGKYWGRKNKYW